MNFINNSNKRKYDDSSVFNKKEDEQFDKIMRFQEKWKEENYFCLEQIFILIGENNKKFEKFAEDTKNAFDRCSVRLECLENKVSKIFEEKDAIIISLEQEKKEMLLYLGKKEMTEKSNDYFT